MSQNISSRKQELLSRLKTTLAIVSQATGFDNDRAGGDMRPGDPSAWGSMRDPRLARKQEVPGISGPGTSTASGPTTSSSRDPGTSSATSSGSVFHKFDDIQDEDEFLYGSNAPESTSRRQMQESSQEKRSADEREQWMQQRQTREDTAWSTSSASHQTGYNDPQWSTAQQSTLSQWAGHSEPARMGGRTSESAQWLRPPSPKRDDSSWGGASHTARYTADEQQPVGRTPQSSLPNVRLQQEPAPSKLASVNADMLAGILKLVASGTNAAGLQQTPPQRVQSQPVQSQPVESHYRQPRPLHPQTVEPQPSSIGYNVYGPGYEAQTMYGQHADHYGYMSAPYSAAVHAIPPARQPHGLDHGEYAYHQYPPPPVHHHYQQQQQPSSDVNPLLSQLAAVLDSKFAQASSQAPADHVHRHADMTESVSSRNHPSMSVGRPPATGTDSQFIAAQFEDRSVPQLSVMASTPQNIVTEKQLTSTSNTFPVVGSGQGTAASVVSTPQAEKPAAVPDKGDSDGQKSDVDKDTLSRLLSMIGCNSNVTQLMQQLVRKDEQEKMRKEQTPTQADRSTPAPAAPEKTLGVAGAAPGVAGAALAVAGTTPAVTGAASGVAGAGVVASTAASGVSVAVSRAAPGVVGAAPVTSGAAPGVARATGTADDAVRGAGRAVAGAAHAASVAADGAGMKSESKRSSAAELQVAAEPTGTDVIAGLSEVSSGDDDSLADSASVPEPKRITTTIPMLSSLSRLQKNYDSGDDDAGRDLTSGSKSKTKDDEWERSTEEFLRRLQAKPTSQAKPQSESSRSSSHSRTGKTKDKTTGAGGKKSGTRQSKGEGKKGNYEESAVVGAAKVDSDAVMRGKREIEDALELLQKELVNLRANKKMLFESPSGAERDEQLEKSLSLERELMSHVTQLKNAMNELNEHLEKPGVGKDLEKSTQRKTSGRDGIKDGRGSRKRSRSHSSSIDRSGSRSSSSDSSSSGGSRSRSSRQRRHKSKSRSHSHGRRPGDRHQVERNVTSRLGHTAGPARDTNRLQQLAKKDAPLPKDAKITASSVAVSRPNETFSVGKKLLPVTSDVKMVSVTQSVGKPATSGAAVPTSSQVKTQQSVMMSTPSSVVPVSANDPVSAMLRAPAVASSTQPPPSSSGSGFAFSRDSIVRNLQEMVKPAVTAAPELAQAADDVELNEKQKSALEFAISMYLAANEFYDGGSLWCRPCDNIFTDISALCRHIHSDRHQLKLDPNYDKPKPATASKKPSCAEGSVVAPARGDEFLMPLQAFFCSLCCEFSKDNVSAEAHLKSREHNNKFKNFLKDNPSYEMQYLRGKMTAVTTMAHRQMEENRGLTSLPQQQQPHRDQFVSELLKMNAETSENSEVKRVKINAADMKQQTDYIVDEEWKQVSLGIEQQARAVQLKNVDTAETKVGEFGSELKRTIINIPSTDSKQNKSGNTASSKIAAETLQKKLTVSNIASNTKQNSAEVEEPEKRRMWDSTEKPSKSRKYDDDKRSSQKRSTRTSPRSRRSSSGSRTPSRSRTPPRSYRRRASPAWKQKPVYGRVVWSLRDDKPVKGSGYSRDSGRKAVASGQSKDVSVVEDTQKQDTAAAGAKSAASGTGVVTVTGVKPSIATSSAVTTSSSASAASTAVSTSAAVTSVPSFKFNWISKPAKQTLMKAGIQSGPMPGRKPTGKAGTEMNINIGDFEVLDECDEA